MTNDDRAETAGAEMYRRRSGRDRMTRTASTPSQAVRCRLAALRTSDVQREEGHFKLIDYLQGCGLCNSSACAAQNCEIHKRAPNGINRVRGVKRHEVWSCATSCTAELPSSFHKLKLFFSAHAWRLSLHLHIGVSENRGP